MLTQKQLENYCSLVLSVGVNLQKDQELLIMSPIECSYMARKLAKKAYELGAKYVRVNYQDEIIDKINFENASKETLQVVPQWFIDSKMQLVKDNACYIVLDAEDPELLANVDKDKLLAYSIARQTALKEYSSAVMRNDIRWCVVSVPTEAWAKVVLPNSNAPIDELWELIAKTMRLDEDDPVTAWKNHISTLTRRADYLNEKNFEYLRFENKKGTNLKVGLATNHKWIAAEEIAKDGVKFIANMPTEEIFTAPHKDKTNGILKSALPLVSDGNVIDEFTLWFENGKIVKYEAEKGYDSLKNLIESDDGSHYIGEVALIGKNSPVSNTGKLFYNTLFDENASCHLAIGKAYPTTVNDGDKMTKEQLLQAGLNDSIVHADFMIGTKDLKVTGIAFDGKETVIFDNGEWII